MEVRKGYKKTKVGIIPEDWEVHKVKNFGCIITGSTPSTKIREYWNGEVPWITPTDITDRKDIYKSERGINSEGLNAIRKLNCNSVLITCIASIGKNAILRKIGACNQQINAIMPNEDHDADFLYYLFENNKQYLLGHAGITATNIISKKEFSEIIFFVPQHSEQTAIATALSDTDALIQSLEKLITKKQNIKQGVMQELLTGKKRLPGFSGEWETKKLGETINFVIDNRGKTPPLSKKGYPLIEVNAIYNQGKSPNISLVKKFVNEGTYNSWFRDGHPQKGDVLVVTVGSAGTTSYVSENIGCIAQNLIAIRLKEDCCSEFFYYLTQTGTFKEMVRAVLMGAVQPSLKVPHINNFSFLFPEKDEQISVAKVLNDMDTEISHLEKKLNKYKMIKQGMMQELLTGKTRLI